MTLVQKRPGGWHINYLGWSGFHIHRVGDQHQFIDPPKGTCFPIQKPICIFITHGHPEHLGGTLDFLRDARVSQPVTVVASQTVCSYLQAQTRQEKVTFSIATPGQFHRQAQSVGFEVFQWQHMPLLPPGVGPAFRHIYQIIRGYRAAWRILKMTMAGPKGAGAMLGYVLHLDDESSVIVYGEGLHRRCRADAVAEIGRRVPGATILVAAEPEDCAELPQLVKASAASEAILYEPHRHWRDVFSLPHADLEALQEAVSRIGVSTNIAHPAR